MKTCPWDIELSTLISSSSRSLWTVWMEGNVYDMLMKVSM
jgi:hypothetical protein